METSVKVACSLLFIALTAANSLPSSLEAYADKYPSTKVSGNTLYNHPTFRRLVVEAAPNAGISATILTIGVEVPIERQGELLVAQMCNPHNCDRRQWTVAILTPNGPAAICYHDRDLMDAEARWFVGGVVIGMTKDCWKGNHTAVPEAVYNRLDSSRSAAVGIR